ncbi:rCG63366 [Rattus norvegicus]|uniref:RCG63366 n=1 Tax=Rattus norvegicus TaxID=10116 RepID=A6IPE4_RAT|nr:rCG63366 [Rattus norvegicus]
MELEISCGLQPLDHLLSIQHVLCPGKQILFFLDSSLSFLV